MISSVMDENSGIRMVRIFAWDNMRQMVKHPISIFKDSANFLIACYSTCHLTGHSYQKFFYIMFIELKKEFNYNFKIIVEYRVEEKTYRQ